MKTYSLITAIALLLSVNLNAQDDAMKADPQHACMMETTASDWKTIGLNDEQLAKVTDIQTTCKKQCDAMKAEKQDGMHESHEKVMVENSAAIEAALSTEQYSKWVAWCADRTTKAKKMN